MQKMQSLASQPHSIEKIQKNPFRELFQQFKDKKKELDLDSTSGIVQHLNLCIDFIDELEQRICLDNSFLVNYLLNKKQSFIEAKKRMGIEQTPYWDRKISEITQRIEEIQV